MDSAVATICGAIIGAALAGPVSYFFTTRTTKRQYENSVRLARANEFNQAAAVFRSAFTEEIRKLEEIDIGNPHECVGQGYVRHCNAVIQFRPYISSTDRSRFTKDWEAYKKAYHSHEFDSQNGNNNKVRDCANKALAYIQRLIDIKQSKG